MHTRARAMLLVSTLGILAIGTPEAFGQIPIPLTVSGNAAQGSLTLPLGIEVDLTISFDAVTGLAPSSLSATATLVNPLDPQLLSRLPGRVIVPGAFPLLLKIDPVTGSGLTFTGAETVSLHTTSLNLDPRIPFSLLKAPDNGSFQDITASEGSGSYRVSGSSGTFSEFLIVVDLRSIDSVTSAKFVALQGSLNSYASTMSSDAVTALQGILSEALADFQAANLPGAIAQMQAFSQYVIDQGGQQIPNVWSSSDPTIVDVAGILRSGADTLTFSLQRESGQ